MRHDVFSFGGIDLARASEWSVREIERAHKEIFAMVWEFIASVHSHAPTAHLVVLLDDIIEQTVAHCRIEESVIPRLGHPTYAPHFELHQLIVDDLLRLRNGAASGQNVSTGEYVHLFDALIVHHVREDLIWTVGGTGWNALARTTTLLS